MGRALRARQLQMARMRHTHMRRRRGRRIPPWVYFNGDDKKAEELTKEAEKSDDEKSEDSDKDTDNEGSGSDAETPNDKGERKIELEDMQLWKNMDLNKDGRLTIAEYERFARSPNAQR